MHMRAWKLMVLVAALPAVVSGQTQYGPGGPGPTATAPSSEPAPPAEPPDVAVLDFEVIGQGADPAVGAALASVIQTALVRGGGVRVIERSELSKVVTEQDLQLTDLVDPSTAIQVGQIAGVDRLVLGSVAAVEQTYTVTCRVIDVATGEAGLAEEFALANLNSYPQLGRLLAAVIGESAVGQDSIAPPPLWTESFDGPECKLKLGSTPKGGGGAALDKGRYIVERTEVGNQYAWIPGVQDRFYAQMDLVQLSGSPKDACGLIWGSNDTDAYLSAWVDGEGGARIERRQGGEANLGLVRKKDWAVVYKPPRANRLRVESWDGRHRVFVNDVCVEDFFEPDFAQGKVGVRLTCREPGASRWAVDNLTVGAIDPSLAGIAVAPAESPRDAAAPGRKPGAGRAAEPRAAIHKVWITREFHEKAPGLRIHVSLDVGNYKSAAFRAIAQFFDAKTGERLKDRDKQYVGRGGTVICERTFSPKYRVSTYNDFGLFIPESQLHLRPGRWDIKCRVILLLESEGDPRQVARSEEVSFTIGR